MLSEKQWAIHKQIFQHNHCKSHNEIRQEMGKNMDDTEAYGMEAEIQEMGKIWMIVIVKQLIIDW